MRPRIFASRRPGLAQRADGFIDAEEDVVFWQDVVELEALERRARPRRFQPGDGDGDAGPAAFPDQVVQGLRGGEVDFQRAAGLDDEQPGL
jgi:hypothetical protein